MEEESHEQIETLTSQDQNLINEEMDASLEETSQEENAQETSPQAAQKGESTPALKIEDFQKIQDENQALKEVFARIVAQQQSQDAPQNEAEQDPLSYINQKIAQLEQFQEHAKLENFFKESIDSYSSVKPDFSAAIAHLYEKTIARWKTISALDGRFSDERLIQQQIEQSLSDLTRQALHQGKNPAELLYNLAVADGYQARVQKNVKEGFKTLTSSSGGNVHSGLTLEDLAEMDDKEFEKLYNSNPEIFKQLA